MSSYRGFWGIQTGGAIEAIADFLSWDKENWAHFERVLDGLERARCRDDGVKQRCAARQLLYQLRYHGAIESRRVGTDTYIRLSNNGWRYAQIRKIRSVTKTCPNGFCIVVFDIPEEHREARDAFRSLLKAAGFEQLQRSVWVHRRAVTDLVCAVVNELGITSWITVAEGMLKTTSFV